MAEEEREGGGRGRLLKCSIQLVVGVVALGACLTWAQTNMTQARINSVEAGVIGNLKTVYSAQASYREAHGSYAADIASLSSAELVPTHWAEGSIGYRYAVEARPPDGWVATATPLEGPQPVYDYGTYTLTTHFYVDESGVVRSESGRAATATSGPRGR